jgi:hypothetical protein
MPDDTSSTSTPADAPTGDAQGGTTHTATPAASTQQQPTQAPSLADIEAERDRWKSHARSHENNWKRATGEIDGLKQQIADRDAAINNATTEAASTLALARLEVGLARAGMPEEAAANYVKFLDPSRLLKDGKPNPEAIAQLVADLPATLRTGPPDPDQGRASNNQPRDMNQLIRRSAGLG